MGRKKAGDILFCWDWRQARFSAMLFCLSIGFLADTMPMNMPSVFELYIAVAIVVVGIAPAVAEVVTAGGVAIIGEVAMRAEGSIGALIAGALVVGLVITAISKKEKVLKPIFYSTLLIFSLIFCLAGGYIVLKTIYP